MVLIWIRLCFLFNDFFSYSMWLLSQRQCLESVLLPHSSISVFISLGDLPLMTTEWNSVTGPSGYSASIISPPFNFTQDLHFKACYRK